MDGTKEIDGLTEVVLGSLDGKAETGDLARRAYLSRTQFFRLFQALIEESPGAMRRRFLLERAAWQLGRTKASVTDIALDANYGSLEAFTRAFRKAYGVTPSLYRRTGCWRIHLPAPNAFHYCEPKGRGQKDTTGETTMDLFDLFAGADSWYMRKLLEHAAGLTDEQLDRPLHSTSKIFPWDKPDQNLREILERMVQTKQVWAAALLRGGMPRLDGLPAAARTPKAMLELFDKAEAEYDRLMREVRDRGTWDETFADALCEPPETFTFGGTFAHVITFNAHRRLMALDALQKLGPPLPGMGCPSEYEASVGGRKV
ncbi:MAG: helix-turn-helix domain-containing protein [Acidobacteriota bacterium]